MLGVDIWNMPELWALLICVCMWGVGGGWGLALKGALLPAHCSHLPPAEHAAPLSSTRQSRLLQFMPVYPIPRLQIPDSLKTELGRLLKPESASVSRIDLQSLLFCPH